MTQPQTPDRGDSLTGHGSDNPGPASISGREVGALETAREDPPPGPGYWVANGHLEDCPYLRSLGDIAAEYEVECDCADRIDDLHAAEDWDGDLDDDD